MSRNARNNAGLCGQKFVPGGEKPLRAEAGLNFTCSGSETFPEGLAGHDLPERAFEFGDVSGFDEQSVLTVSNDVPGTGVAIATDNWKSVGHCFQKGVREAFVFGTQNEQVGCGVLCGNVGIPTRELDPIQQFEMGDQLFEFASLRSFSDDAQIPIRDRRGQAGENRDKRFEPFVRIESTNSEETFSSVGRMRMGYLDGGSKVGDDFDGGMKGIAAIGSHTGSLNNEEIRFGVGLATEVVPNEAYVMMSGIRTFGNDCLCGETSGSEDRQDVTFLGEADDDFGIGLLKCVANGRDAATVIDDRVPGKLRGTDEIQSETAD